MSKKKQLSEKENHESLEMTIVESKESGHTETSISLVLVNRVIVHGIKKPVKSSLAKSVGVF